MITIETRRKMTILKLGKTQSEATKQKLCGIDRRPFPPHCIKCVNRDFSTCAKYNKSCFKARETDCFKRHGRRKEHPDYRKSVEV